MKKTPLDSIVDMIESIDHVYEFMEGIDPQELHTDLKTDYAVLRCFSILGEAISRIDPEFRAIHSEIPWNKIKGLRNIIVHDYDAIHVEMIRKILNYDFPPLKIQLEAIKQELLKDETP
jgi:uncharacterized protein with HEPN domain